jgi:hypothetical protein
MFYADSQTPPIPQYGDVLYYVAFGHREHAFAWKDEELLPSAVIAVAVAAATTTIDVLV